MIFNEVLLSAPCSASTSFQRDFNLHCTDGLDDFVLTEFGSGEQGYGYSVGTRRFSSSNQFTIRMTCMVAPTHRPQRTGAESDEKDESAEHGGGV